MQIILVVKKISNINIRPKDGNRSIEIESVELKNKILKIVEGLIEL